MIHTFWKSADDRYQIGIWLHNNTFNVVGEVGTLMLAFQAVNYLNGGDGDRALNIVSHFVTQDKVEPIT